MARSPSTIRYLIFVQIVLCCSIANGQQDNAFDWIYPQLKRLREEQRNVETELTALGTMAIGNTSTEIGAQFHMKVDKPEYPRSVRIDLGKVQSFETILIAPAVDVGKTTSYAFPKSVEIDVADDETFANATPIATATDTSMSANFAFPLIVRCSNSKGRFVRIRTIEPANVAGLWTSAFGEIMIVRGNRNIAIGKRIWMDDAPEIKPRWHVDYLIDGRTPYGARIDGALPQFDGAYCETANADDPKWIRLDFGTLRQIDEIRLQPIHSRQGAALTGYGFPVRFRVEVSEEASFDNAIVLHDSGDTPFSNPGTNSVTFACPETHARFVRVLCNQTPANELRRFGLAEISVYSGNKNIAKSAKLTTSGIPHPQRPPELLVDGYSSYGKILEIPNWIDRWEKFQNLKRSQTQLEEAIDFNVGIAIRRFIYWVVALLMILIVGVFSYLGFRAFRRKLERQAFRLQLAQNLHDQIGSNLAAISRLGEIAKLEGRPSNDWNAVHQLAIECTDSMRETLWLLGGREQTEGDIVDRLKRTAFTMLPDLQIRWFDQRNDRQRWAAHENETSESRRELFLAFKAIIANIANHSNASEVRVTIGSVGRGIAIEIKDNGDGFDIASGRGKGLGLRSVEQRIEKIRGTVDFASSQGEGMTVNIVIEQLI